MLKVIYPIRREAPPR